MEPRRRNPERAGRSPFVEALCAPGHCWPFYGIGAPLAAAKSEYHSSRLKKTESALAQARNRLGACGSQYGLNLRRMFEKPG